MNAPNDFERLIRASAPAIRPEFVDELADRLAREHFARRRSRAVLTAVGPSPGSRLTWRVAALFVLLVFASVGGVLAVSGVLQTWIQSDEGLSAAWRSDTGIELNQSVTLDGLTLTAEWVSADWNRLAIGFTLSGLVCPPRYDAGCFIGVTASSEDAAELQLLVGRADESDVNHRIYLYEYSVAGLDSAQTIARIELRVVPMGGWVTGPHPDNPNVQTWEQEPLDDALVLNLSIPLSRDVRLMTDPISASDQGVAMTLRRVVVTPTQTRVAVCFRPPSADRTWTAIPRLTAEGAEVAGGGADLNVVGIGETHGETCREFPFNAAMSGYGGRWRLEIVELVGFGLGGGADQQRVAGTWVFEFQTTP